jgi:nitronate monooxygenase
MIRRGKGGLMRTWLTERFGLEVPVVGAPMANIGGGEMAAAVSVAGGLGTIGAGASQSADWIREHGARAAASGKPYGIGVMAWALPDRPQQVEAILELRPDLVSVSFGDITPYVEPLRSAGIVVAAQAGTVEDAVRAAGAGVDVIVARGGEAGGHGRDRVATLPLLQAVLDAVDLPVLAAGGISGPRGLAAVLAAGAAGAWVGTAFLTCTEAMTAPSARRRLLDADETATVYGIVFDRASRAGWPDEFGGRALRNAFFDRWYGREDELSADDAAHAEFVAGVRAADSDVLSMYAGQGVHAIRAERSAADVVASFAAAEDLLRKALG